MRSASTSRAWLALAPLLAAACNSALSQPFELTCAYVRADQEATWRDAQPLRVLAAHPFNAAAAVAYGSPACSGFVLDLHNPDARSPRALSIDAGGALPHDVASGELFAARQSCAARTLSVDVWGKANEAWTPLMSETVSAGKLEQRAAQARGSACALEIAFAARPDDVRGATGTSSYASRELGAYRSYRVIGRVSNGSLARFPFRVELH
jgi:hypothetical protein